MSHYAIVVDLDRCIGCHGCEIACKNENEVELGSFWNKVVQVGPFGDYPHLHQYFLPVMCQQCDDSPCTHVCPTGASYRDGNNVVLIDREKCIGCKYCMMACPYGVRDWNKASKKKEIFPEHSLFRKDICLKEELLNQAKEKYVRFLTH